MANLDDLLALLPDNTTGDISAADLRAVVTTLYTDAHTLPYQSVLQFATTLTPANGRVCVPGWGPAAATLLVSETADDGELVPFGLIDATSPNEFRLANTGGTLSLRGRITGPSVDHGTYRELPVTVDTATAAPVSGNTLTLSVLAFWEVP